MANALEMLMSTMNLEIVFSAFYIVFQWPNHCTVYVFILFQMAEVEVNSGDVSKMKESEKVAVNTEHLLKVTRQDLLVTRKENKELRKEVNALKSKLLSSDKRLKKEREEYDTNLSSLGLKLLHFESQLSKEQQEIEQLLIEKDKQIKAQEDLIEALRRSLKDKPICNRCNHFNQSPLNEQLRPDLYKTGSSLQTSPDEYVERLESKNNLILPLDLSNNVSTPKSLRNMCHHILSPVPEELECTWSEQGSPLTPGRLGRLSDSSDHSPKESSLSEHSIIDHSATKDTSDATLLDENVRSTEESLSARSETSDTALLDENVSIVQGGLSVGSEQNISKQLGYDEINTKFEIKIILDQIIEKIENESSDKPLSDTLFLEEKIENGSSGKPLSDTQFLEEKVENESSDNHLLDTQFLEEKIENLSIDKPLSGTQCLEEKVENESSDKPLSDKQFLEEKVENGSSDKPSSDTQILEEIIENGSCNKPLSDKQFLEEKVESRSGDKPSSDTQILEEKIENGSSDKPLSDTQFLEEKFENGSSDKPLSDTQFLEDKIENGSSDRTLSDTQSLEEKIENLSSDKPLSDVQFLEENIENGSGDKPLSDTQFLEEQIENGSNNKPLSDIQFLEEKIENRSNDNSSSDAQLLDNERKGETSDEDSKETLTTDLSPDISVTDLQTTEIVSNLSSENLVVYDLITLDDTLDNTKEPDLSIARSQTTKILSNVSAENQALNDLIALDNKGNTEDFSSIVSLNSISDFECEHNRNKETKGTQEQSENEGSVSSSNTEEFLTIENNMPITGHITNGDRASESSILDINSIDFSIPDGMSSPRNELNINDPLTTTKPNTELLNEISGTHSKISSEHTNGDLVALDQNSFEPKHALLNPLNLLLPQSSKEALKLNSSSENFSEEYDVIELDTGL